MRYFVPAIALIAMAAPAAAQDRVDTQAWGTVSGSTALSDNVNLSLEVVTRFGDRPGGLYEAEFGGMLGYKLPGGIEISAGYVRVPNYSHGDTTSIEDRARQQVGAKFGSILGGQLSGRARLEERFRNTGNDMGWRLRPQLKFSRPFVSGGKTALVLSHESFFELNSTDWGQRSGYDRMRNFVGISTPVTKSVKAEIGYLNQYKFARKGRGSSMDNVASVSLSFGF